MKIDFATLAFGYQVLSGGNTPNWATALGQGKDYKINDSPEIDVILKGMIYSGVNVSKVKTKVGKGGSLVSGADTNSPISLAAVFNNVYVNDTKINAAKFILLIVKDLSGTHAGRLKLKYGPSNTFVDGTTTFSNQDFFNLVKSQLGLDKDACWYVSEINIDNQNKLILKTTIVDANGSVEYEDNAALHAAWGEHAPNTHERIEANEQKKKFRIWMSQQKKGSGDPYSLNTITSYINQMERGYSSFNKYNNLESVFDIQDESSLKEYTDYLFNADGFLEFNEKAGNKACSCGLVKYREFLNEQDTVSSKIIFHTGIASEFSRNRIVFGAPGTGKSFKLNDDRETLLGKGNELDYERVTFHPDYSYANFVGTYKPVPCKDDDGKDVITYEYVPGPFMRVYTKAVRNGCTENAKPFLLLIEEINRANVAAVFGDIFQLLDRNEENVSEYPIQASEDIKKYLSKELGGDPDDYTKLQIPDNMFIWATMNSADQGVFPMDTAFKRRWDFTYIGIDDNDKDIDGKYVLLGKDSKQKVEWNKLRKAINYFLADKGINEDKQLGPYFISRKIVVPESGKEIDKISFCETFKNKVLMYLFEDAAKQKRQTLFEGCVLANKNRYSSICKEFDEVGIEIFNNAIVSETKPETISETEAAEE